MAFVACTKVSMTRLMVEAAGVVPLAAFHSVFVRQVPARDASIDGSHCEVVTVPRDDGVVVRKVPARGTSIDGAFCEDVTVVVDEVIVVGFVVDDAAVSSAPRLRRPALSTEGCRAGDRGRPGGRTWSASLRGARPG